MYYYHSSCSWQRVATLEVIVDYMINFRQTAWAAFGDASGLGLQPVELDMPLTFDVLCCPVMSQTGPVEMPFSL